MSKSFWPNSENVAPRMRGWPQFERAARQTRLFGLMLDRLGASDTARQEGLASIAAAGESCLVCRHAVACERWLTAGGGETAPAFCPGAAVFGHREAEEAVG